jgi:hypothetical protein
MVGVPDALDATVGRRNDVVEGVAGEVASSPPLRLAVKMPPGSFGEDGPGFGGGSDSEVG